MSADAQWRQAGAAADDHVLLAGRTAEGLRHGGSAALTQADPPPAT